MKRFEKQRLNSNDNLSIEKAANVTIIILEWIIRFLFVAFLYRLLYF